MGQYASATQLNGLFLQVKGDVQDLIKPMSIVREKIPFAEGKKLGSMFIEQIILTDEHGMTWGTPDQGAITLNASIAMQSKQAQVQAYQSMLRSSVPYDVIAESASTEAAFKKAIVQVSSKMLDSHIKKDEIDCIYGQTAGVLGQTSASTNVDTTHTTLTIATGTWAPGIWVGAEGARLEVHDNTDDDLVSTGADAIFAVTAVDFTNKKVTVSGTTTGISALDTACSGTTENLYWYGSVTGTGVTFAYNMKPGIKKAITNTGTLHNISASSSTGYTAWTGTTHSAASGPASFSKLMSGIAKAIGKGQLSGKAVAITSVASWVNLMTDQAALRRYMDVSTKSAKNGFEDIMFAYGPGVLEVCAHPCVKEGDLFVVSPGDWKRVGARELAMGAPGEEDAPFQRLADVTAVEARAYGNETMYCSAPNRQVYVNSIVPA